MKLTINCLLQLYTELKMRFDMKDKWQTVIQSRDKLKQITSEDESIIHTVTEEECVAYSNFING